ncbi:hypothetical protein O6H91_23G029600 [Diphasiastrum complanatum]|uniref:Uncharacterized protein n=1 Tax=Diphasiastrum complanatum TaxID=34168 RepID=A0ACC2A996_DIPCM|nr:hypothetical protein O6H91_23G029600 [Diphasiastrum complanatum]
MGTYAQGEEVHGMMTDGHCSQQRDTAKGEGPRAAETARKTEKNAEKQRWIDKLPALPRSSRRGETTRRKKKKGEGKEEGLLDDRNERTRNKIRERERERRDENVIVFKANFLSIEGVWNGMDERVQGSWPENEGSGELAMLFAPTLDPRHVSHYHVDSIRLKTWRILNVGGRIRR